MRSGAACVALAGGGTQAQEQDGGDASVPTHHIRHPRPYEYETASEGMSHNTYPCKSTPAPTGTNALPKRHHEIPPLVRRERRGRGRVRSLFSSLAVHFGMVHVANDHHCD